VIGMWRFCRNAALYGCVAVAFACGQPAWAESLEDALANAYIINPLLNAERARVRAIDEDVARANSGYRPQIFGGADYGIDKRTTSPSALNDGTTHPHGYDITLSQPLFQGFQVLNRVRQAKSTVQAGRESLRSVEQQVLLEAVVAYVDVVRDQAVVQLRQSDVEVLAEELRATRDRFEVGEVTRTDVAQAEARHSEAITGLNVAQANLKASRAAYERVVGHPPSHPGKPASIAYALPSSLDEAMSLGDAEHPEILAAVYREEASLYNVQAIMGEMLPNAQLQAGYEKRFDQGPFFDWQERTTVTARVNVPLYQGGEVSARVRQAKEQNNELRRLIEDLRLRVNADVVSQWGFVQSSRASIESARAAIAANRIALEGVREEERVGQRTTLDVLDAQRELVNTEVILVTAERDLIAAEYALYAAMGRLNAQTLGLHVPYYDPTEHYEIVKNKWFGLRPPPPPEPDQ
jgi:outer membrane protein